MSDWKKHIELQLNNSKIYQTLKENLKLKGDEVEANQMKLIYEVVEYAYEKSKLIIKYMPEYTLHDGEHLFRVLYLMERIIPKENLPKLSNPELLLLILTAFFHDIGMAPLENEIRAWQEIWDGEEPTEYEIGEFNKFKRFKNTFPDKIEEIIKLQADGKFATAQSISAHIISEYIRTTHAQRAREIIGNEWNGKILYKNQDLTSTLADLCLSHNEDAMSLLNLENDLLCDEDDVINLPYLGIILRIADLLDFDAKRTPSVLFSHLAVRNPVSLKEWEKHRSVRAWSIESNNITFSAVCKHPAIEASIRKFCDDIDDQLKNCNVILSKNLTNPKYKLELPANVNRTKIAAEKDISTGEPKYIYRDTSFHLSKKQVIDLLMGTKLYGDPEVALRELLQNSIDACLLSKALHEKWKIPYLPSITVKYYSIKDEDFLEVIDNGIGMNQEIIEKFYSKIGSSYYQSRDFFDLKASSELNFKPISRFGIGILSSFMVADTLEVETRRLKDKYEYDSPLKLIIEGYDSIFTTLKSSRKEPGTSTKLFLRKNINPWRSMSDDEFINVVKNAISKPEFEINIETDKEKIVYNKEDFYLSLANNLKDFLWQEDENVKEYNITFDEEGIEGNAIIAVIEKNGVPFESIDRLSKTIEIDDETFDLSLEIKYSENRISKYTTNINISNNGELHSNSSTSYILNSKAKFSMHGISFGGDIFPSWNNRNKKTVLNWPFPILIVLNIGGQNDLDLNSARNEIIYSKKWDFFEEKLAFIILNKIKIAMGETYWNDFLNIIKKSNSESFLKAIENLK